MVQIEILSGPDCGQIFDLAIGTHILGRAASSSHVLGVESVSGRHLELTVSAAGDIHFRDLGSTNGTWSGGVQVVEGEWFPGSELKLGKCVLRFVVAGSASASSSSATADEDRDIHRRAREAALSGKRKGGPLQLALGAVLLVAAAGGAWWTWGRGNVSEEAFSEQASQASGAGTASSSLDAIDGYGGFEDPEAWSLSKGLEMADGRLRSNGGRQFVRLSKEFGLDESALEIQAEVSGLRVFPQITWGKGGEGSAASGVWECSDLASGIATLSLPQDADWFQLALRLEGQGSVKNLSVQTTSGTPSRLSSPLGVLLHDGANMQISNSSGSLLVVRGHGGSWSATNDGMLFTPDGSATLVFTASGDLLAEGSFLILANGGPVGLAPGVIVDSSPGILFGGGATRLLLSLEQASTIRFEDGGASVTTSQPLHLRWDLAEAMTQAARLAQKISRAEKEGDDQLLLSSAAELLRHYPLDELKVQDALLRSREALERGRADLAGLQVQASGAVFVGAGSVMSELANAARALAVRYPGTTIEPQATALADDLEMAASQAALGSRQAAARYRERLQGALSTSYPVLAAWLQEAN